MAQDWYTLDELAKSLGRDRREIEKLVQRGRIPGRKVNDIWQCHAREVTHWLEQELREYSESDLEQLEATQHSEEIESDHILAELLHLETIEIPLNARTKRSVLESLIELAGKTWQVFAPADVLKAVIEREEIHSTAYENGVAIPHPRNPMEDALGESVIAFGTTLGGIPFGAPKRVLSDIFFLVLCKDSKTHLKVLARLGRVLQSDDLVDELRACQSAEEAYALLLRAEEELLGT